MAVSYSSEKGIEEGLRMTFDQEHPCCMCQALNKKPPQDTTQEDDKQVGENEVCKALDSWSTASFDLAGLRLLDRWVPTWPTGNFTDRIVPGPSERPPLAV
jgi:hypothetical protein